MITVFLKAGTRIELPKASGAKVGGNTVDNSYLNVFGEDGKTIVATFRYLELGGWILGEDYGVHSP